MGAPPANIVVGQPSAVSLSIVENLEGAANIEGAWEAGWPSARPRREPAALAGVALVTGGARLAVSAFR